MKIDKKIERTNMKNCTKTAYQNLQFQLPCSVGHKLYNRSVCKFSINTIQMIYTSVHQHLVLRASSASPTSLVWLSLFVGSKLKCPGICGAAAEEEAGGGGRGWGREGE